MSDFLPATPSRPSHDEASSSKLALEPDLRQMNPVVVETGFITIKPSSRSPDEAKRNPGTINKLQCRPGFHPGYEEIKGSGTP
jgi:hypothetical protein